jgi:hypothetical protein
MTFDNIGLRPKSFAVLGFGVMRFASLRALGRPTGADRSRVADLREPEAEPWLPQAILSISSQVRLA